MNNNKAPLFSAKLDEGGTKGTILIEGTLSEYSIPEAYKEFFSKNEYYAPQDFRDALAECRDCKEVEVRINSVGGDLCTGLAIHNELLALKGTGVKVTTCNIGIAASAASVIFCAGEERTSYPGSILMIHGASVMVGAIASANEKDIADLIGELKKARSSVQAANKTIAAVYARVTGKSEEECLGLISDGREQYMTAREAIDGGFATGMVEDAPSAELKLVACAGKDATLMSRGKLLTTHFQAPANASELGFITAEAASAAEATNPNETNMNEEKTTQAAETEKPVAEAAAPTFTAAQVEEARLEAAKSERARIADINAKAEKLGNRVARELVDKAIADGMTPEAFAAAAVDRMPAEAAAAPQQPVDYLTARAAEMAPANALGTAGNGGNSVKAEKSHGHEILDYLDQQEKADKKD